MRHAKGQKTLFAKDGVAILLKRAKAIVGETVEMTATMCDLCVTMHSCVGSDMHMSVLSAFSVRESVVLFLLFFKVPFSLFFLFQLTCATDVCMLHASDNVGGVR